MMTADVMTSVKIVVMTLLIQPSNQDCVLGNIKVHKNKGPKPKKIMRETSLISSIPRAEKVKYTLSIPRATVTMHMARISGASVIQLNFPISPETASNALRLLFGRCCEDRERQLLSNRSESIQKP